MGVICINGSKSALNSRVLYTFTRTQQCRNKFLFSQKYIPLSTYFSGKFMMLSWNNLFSVCCTYSHFYNKAFVRVTCQYFQASPKSTFLPTLHFVQLWLILYGWLYGFPHFSPRFRHALRMMKTKALNIMLIPQYTANYILAFQCSDEYPCRSFYSTCW